MFSMVKRILRSGWQSFYRDGEIAVATVFILFLAVTLISSLFIFRDITQVMIYTVQKKVDVSVYFKEDIAEEEIINVSDRIMGFPEVKEIEYVSKQEALEYFTQKHQNDAVLLEAVEELGKNPFLASLNITTWDASQYAKISQFLEGGEFENIVEKVDYFQRKTVIERIRSLSSFVSKVGIVFSVILVIVAIAVTFNTIRLSIYNLRDEIKIQRLVGASNWFIRGPFLVQGIISGVLATVISILIFSSVCWFLGPRVETFLSDLNIYTIFLENFWLLVMIQFATGVGLGIISSMFAIRKYLEA